MYQADHEYPSLHVMITDNPRYHEGRLCVTSVKEALKKIETWMRKRFDEPTEKS